MYLTKEEEKVLRGDEGEVKARAFKVIVKVGEIFGAERLVNISHAHVSGISYFNIGKHGVEFLRDLANNGAKFSVFTTANPYAAHYLSFNGRGFSKNVIDNQEQIINTLISMGAHAFTCAPYHIRRPGIGEHLAWAESNAVLYANSVLGAKTNREGGPLALLEAIVGKTPYYGMHMDEERCPSILIKVPKPSSLLEAAAIGYLVGKISPSKIPYVEGLGKAPEEWLKAFLAGVGTTSSAPMVFLEGITPDRRRVKKDNIQERVKLSEEDVKSFIKEHSPSQEVTGNRLYVIGCPHVSKEEIRKITLRMEKTYSNVRNEELWIITGCFSLPCSKILVKPSSKVKIVEGVCPVVTRLDLLGVEEVVTDSAKALHYLPRLAHVRSFIMDRKEILKRFGVKLHG